MSGRSLNWHDLRPWRGSQHSAFEEVCAQLAAAEPPSAGAAFVRTAAPDAGVECYWHLPTGEEWAWQAKFFSNMGDTQWRQLDESVAKALEKHPRLVEYIVCVPLNFADSRQDGKVSSMDRWRQQVTKWDGWARSRDMCVQFTHWGEHELANRLMQDQHRGRVLYWFEKQLFSREWFENRLEEAVANADQRYLPALNVDLAIQDNFDGLGRTSKFFDRFKVMLGKIRRAFSHLSEPALDAVASDAAAHLQERVTACLQTLADLPEGMQPLPLPEILDRAQELVNSAQRMEELVWQAGRKPDARQAPSERQGRSLDAERYYLDTLVREARALEWFAGTKEVALANTAALLLIGTAGMGKTHLLCHVACARAKVDRSTILILSEQLANGEPWSEIMRALRLQCDADEFLGALNAAGQARGSRTLVLIDALNEGDGRAMWERHLPGFLTHAARYPWVGVVISVRESYEETMVPRGSVEARLVRIEHRGFSGAEARAATHFLSHYGIVAPTIPPLHPEFSNPLFLRLFCQGLQNLGYRQLPPGLHGLTSVFTFFLDSVNVKLASRNLLDVNPGDRIVQRCVERLAEAMASAQRQWLPRDEARTLVDSFHQSSGYERSLFRHLLIEGVLAEDRFHTAEDVWTEGVRFTYQKFADHLITQFVLKKHLDLGDPASSFVRGAPLGDLVADELACWRHKGLIEALAVQLPELVGRELPDLVPHAAGLIPVREAMIEGIIWRKPETFTEATNAYLNEWLLPLADTFGLTMSALLTTAPQVNHPYNAHGLHRHLTQLRRPNRDEWWSIYLHREYIEGDSGIIRRLLDWCEIDQGKRELSDESVLLAGITVTWFLTSANRFLRDHATKVLVRLLTPRLAVLANLVRLFKDVDDPYVLERLMAAAYGCVMRSVELDGIHAVAKASYDVFFADDIPIHVLLRDYARGVIERALYLRDEPTLQRARITPPHESSWPEKIPTLEELKAAGYDAHDVHPAQRRLCFSVLDDDFARYVIGTNSWSFEWANLSLRASPPPSRREQTRGFVASLDGEQRIAWRRFQRIFREERKRYLKLLPELLIQSFGTKDQPSTPVTADSPKDRAELAIEAFLVVLSKEQQDTFTNYVVPFLRNGEQRFREEDRFDLRLLQGYILPRVFTLGWTAAMFGEFDLEVRDRGRESHKAERIGKKYQWIAYHEVLALVADHYVFKGSSWSEQAVPYGGPWQVSGLRDIDPSMLLRESMMETRRLTARCWWAPEPYQEWYAIRPSDEWLRTEEDLPSLIQQMIVTDPSDGSRWLTLEAHYSWEEPTPPDMEWSDLSHRSLWYQVNALIVRKEDCAELFSWAQQQDFWGRWMPESGRSHDVFLGEFYWSPAYREQFADERGNRAWTRGDRQRRLPKEVIVPSMAYSGGTSLDCSLEEPVHVFLPAPWLAEQLGLQWAGVEGEFCGPDGARLARDPSVTTPGPPALLVSEPALRDFLNGAEYEIIWTVLGCKAIVGPRSDIPFEELHLNGSFRYSDGKIEGEVKGTYRTYPARGE
jgi:hypothetical protein